MKRAPLAQVGPNQPHVGWEVTQDEGGAWRIKPRQRSRPTMGLLLVAAGLGCCGFVWLLFVKLNRGGGDWRSLRLTMLLPLGLLLIGQGIRTAFGREEWLASADLLEVQWSVWGFRRTRRFRGATLGLVAATNSSATRPQRRLLRAARAGKRARDRAPD